MPGGTVESLTIGELAARSGVAPSALRYYERLGLIRAGRTGGNQRRYERAELRRVAFIRIAAQIGVPLEEIKEALDGLPDRRTPTQADWAKLSARWQHRLDERIHLLERLRDELTQARLAGATALQADHHQPAADGQGRDVARQVVTALDVEDDVDAAPAGRVEDRGEEVHLGVVDGDLRAQLAQGLVLGRARGGQDPRAARRRELDRERADPATAAVHQQRLAFGEPGRGAEVGPDRARDLRQRRRLHQISRYRHELSHRHGDLLGV